MNLYFRYIHGFKGVVDGVGVVGPGARVDEEPIGGGGGLDPADKLPLVVGLAELERHLRELLFEGFFEVF